MDINFHFYAVKVIALLSGFDAFESKVIAEFSQFVDDYIPEEAYPLMDVPPFADCLVRDNQFRTVQTGFTLMKNGMGLLQEAKQKNYVIPFHFIPPYYKRTDHDYKVIRAHIGDKCLINQLLEKAARSYHESKTNEDRMCSLIRIGITLHIFADTYAHENFNGYWSDMNFAYVEAAQENHRIDRTARYSMYDNAPNVGHACLSTAPDETYTRFSVVQGKGNPVRWQRDNTEAFQECAFEILKYLSMVKRGTSPNNREQMDSILYLGFTEVSPEKWYSTWDNAWEAYRNDYPVYHDFYYSKENLKRVTKPFKDINGNLKANPIFYYYNYNAYLIRETVKQILR